MALGPQLYVTVKRTSNAPQLTGKPVAHPYDFEQHCQCHPAVDAKFDCQNQTDWAKLNQALDSLIADGKKFDKVYITGHGGPGFITGFFNVNDLGKNTDVDAFLAKLSQLVDKDTVIEIRACKVAAFGYWDGIVNGQAFIQEIANITGAEVHAWDGYYAIMGHDQQWIAKPGGHMPTKGDKGPPSWKIGGKVILPNYFPK